MHRLSEVYSRLKEKGFFRGSRERVCIDSVLELLEKQVEGPSLTFIQLPPGYGKTAIPYSLCFWAISNDDTRVERAIQVLPLRSIVENVVGRFIGRDKYGETHGALSLGLTLEEAKSIAGGQCMFMHEASFMQKSFVATTLDTFSLTAAKLPPVELQKIAREYVGGMGSFGHYEIARGAILSSVVVFDEAHLFIEEREKESKATTLLISLIVSLLELHVPVVVLTATLPSRVREWLGEEVRKYLPNINIERFEYGVSGLRDNDFEGEISSVKLRTFKVKSDPDYISRIVEEASRSKRVLVVANTVSRARRIYDELSNHLDNLLLLHSKFTQKDREKKLSCLEKDEEWVCVSTQVVEAGVDVSADALFTDIAPFCSLVQRAGRCCRPSHVGSSGEGSIVICVSDEAVSEAEKVYHAELLGKTRLALEKVGEQFNWHSYESYIPLVNESHSVVPRKSASLLMEMKKFLLDPFVDSKDAFAFLLDLGSFTRDSPLVTGIVCDESEVKDGLLKEEGNYIPLELSDVREIAKMGGTKIVVREGKVREESIAESELSRPKNFYEKVLLGSVAAVRIPPGVYDSDRGLRI
ncbi:MAG: CRISPR-associated helicase Cas3' [Candidatus Jordarchaeales archaeon]